MSGLLGKIENAMGMTNTANDTSTQNKAPGGGNMDPSSNAQAAPGTNTNTGTTTPYTGTDKYEGALLQGEGYVKQHYSDNANVMRGEGYVEKADAYRLGRNNMNNMETGVGGTMDANPQHITGLDRPGAGGVEQSKAAGVESMGDKETIQYGQNSGLGGPVTGGIAGQGTQNTQNM